MHIRFPPPEPLRAVREDFWIRKRDVRAVTCLQLPSSRFYGEISPHYEGGSADEEAAASIRACTCCSGSAVS
ncbi:hypothetical protein DOE73_18345 [Paenibacillus dendritiformis]|nr:hypothetical protein DOE73_18345 [Paenibacillus dendritiformis]